MVSGRGLINAAAITGFSSGTIDTSDKLVINSAVGDVSNVHIFATASIRAKLAESPSSALSVAIREGNGVRTLRIGFRVRRCRNHGCINVSF